MSLNRYAKRRDENEGAIVDALRAVGCLVHRQDFPDLAVKHQGRLYWMEISNPNNRYRKRSDKQLAMLKLWDVPVVEYAHEAMAYLGIKVTL
jgi:hypothetical protein